METTVPNTIPVNWHPEWPGVCSCGTESISILAVVNDETHAIEMYDLWVQCSYCHKNYTLKVPPKDWAD